ncbi:bifunctional hydroxymethylpyrimidine kinase/phosphomethylpyrimidine kinase [Natronomonas amylolytica]|uniref:bifunctional hydroxymethylpyrimidine kinase/phosphomethylpyrimidine kinase n=1 Tax=Natronomonas amylolytica TaxID=3108498 RepID=UPI00300BD8BA
MSTLRRPAPVKLPQTLTIAGSDSGGGAGVQADLKTMEALDTFATSAITSLTAQNTVGVESIHPVPVEEIEAQVDAIRDDFELQAVKTGMLGVEPVVETVTSYAADMDVPFVVDPVMVATSGDRLLDHDAEAAYKELIAESTVVTPNADEAEILTDIPIADPDSMQTAGQRLVEMGAETALIKGGHVGGEHVVRDVIVTQDDVTTLKNARVDSVATHGSGCTLSSAIAARLAHGEDIPDAIEFGVDFMTRAIRYPLDVGEGPGTVHHLANIRDRSARQPTQETVESVVQQLVSADVSAIVPEVGMNVVGATPYAERPGDTVAVEGRIAQTMSGIRSTRGTRFGASSHVARFLLSAQEHDPALRFAANLRFNDAIERVLEEIDATVVEIDRSNEPEPGEEGSTMSWAAERAFEQCETTPAIVFDRGDVGKEPITRLLAKEDDLTTRALSIAERI